MRAHGFAGFIFMATSQPLTLKMPVAPDTMAPNTTAPITLADYMALCNAHYYAEHIVFGRAGDFITAPELTPMFGEMLGLWLYHSWQQQGAPTPFILCELGGGRGHLLKAALHATRNFADFNKAMQLYALENSPRRRTEQAHSIAPRNAIFIDAVNQLPPLPLFFIANEFFDALPVQQFIFTAQGWQERCVQSGPQAHFTSRPTAQLPAHLPPTAPLNTIAEYNPTALTMAHTLAQHIAAQGGAGLIIDYGYFGPAFGDTLQAIGQQQSQTPLANPGATDLTAHVDFGLLSQTIIAAGASCTKPIAQGVFLRRLGIEQRAHQLCQLYPQDATQILAALQRLLAPAQMGLIFQAMALTAPQAPTPAGFT